MAAEGEFPKVAGDTMFASEYNRIDILSATATFNGSDATASSTFSDTSSTVTLSGLTAAHNYTFFALVTGTADAGGGNVINARLVIGSTNTSQSRVTGIVSPLSLSGTLKSQTGVTSITAKVQFSNNDNSTTVNWGDNKNVVITIFALKE